MERIDCVVIGAGVVGLAVARSLAQAGREVVVLEAANEIGTGISSRNSEVIHAGIYYPQNSLKASFCIAGRHALYAYCEKNGISHRRCGKLIVATNPDQVHKLEQIKQQAAANGVDDLKWLTAQEAMALEPELHCVSALMSPSTGIVDSHALMLSLQGDAERAGAVFAFQSGVQGGEVTADGIKLSVHDEIWTANTVVNCAGLAAPRVAASLHGLEARFVPQAFYAKGNYFSYAGRSHFSRLIYPVPEIGGLGVHLTLDLMGRMRFGPDVEWIAEPDYKVDPARADGFYAEIRKYWPALPNSSLQPDYCGIRPKLTGPGEAAADFRIDGPAVHGVSGLINLFGIESPGLTSAFAIADHVRNLLI
ncbi:MAG: NAD(P)/FAD-dependent oxidoreductase [Burkholderiaceae bacterium]